MHTIETMYEIQNGLRAMNALDMNGANKLPNHFSDLSVEALDILSGGETSTIIELNRSIANVQKMLETQKNKNPSLTPPILMLQTMFLNLQMLMVNTELASPKYDYLWAAVAAYYNISTANNNPFALKQISRRKLSKSKIRKIRNSRSP